MGKNKVEGVQSLTLVDDVLFYANNTTRKPFVQAVDNRVTGFTLELSDVGKYIRVNSADALTVIVPNLEFPIGSIIVFEQTGAGAITLSGSGVTLNGNPVSSGQYGVLQIIKVTSSVWTIIGGIESV